jgi:TonB family protein
VFSIQSFRARSWPAHAAFALVCLCIVTPCFSSHAHAQQKTDKPAARKLVYKVNPDYPWDLRRASIGGVVRLDVVVSSRGTVDSVAIIGGNPILAESASRAVKKWKYAPADSDTTIRLNVEFDPKR